MLSKPFDIDRRTTQGDTLSPIMFKAVLESIMRNVQPIWRQRGWGSFVGDSLSDALANLRFADDVLLIGTSRRQIVGMLNDLVKAAAETGLEVRY